MAKKLFQRGQSGNPAGRPRHSHTRKELLDMLYERFGDDYDPLVKLAEIAADPETSRSLRVRCLAEIAPYIHPRRKAVEHDLGASTLEDLVTASLAERLKNARERALAGKAERVTSPSAELPAVPSSADGVSGTIARAREAGGVVDSEPAPLLTGPSKQPVQASDYRPRPRPIPITLPDSEPDGFASGQVFNPT